MIPKFCLNRFDTRSITSFTEDVRRAESLGWDGVFLPDSQLLVPDTYVLLAQAALSTSQVVLSPFVANPINRHPTVTASSIATIASLAPDRTLLTIGVGDTAVRLAGMKPASLEELANATQLIRGLLDGQSVDLGASRPAHLEHHHSLPVWIAAGGPGTLEMAGRAADGVFIRVGTSPESIRNAVQQIELGARSVGLEPGSISVGAVFHTVLVDDKEHAVRIAKSIAAGYFEYTPSLFNSLGITWSGPSPRDLKRRNIVWPDFHHDPDLLKSGDVVSFLSEETASAFCLWGNTNDISEQLLSVLKSSPINFEYVILQPIPNPTWPNDNDEDFTSRIAKDVLPRVRTELSSAERTGK